MAACSIEDVLAQAEKDEAERLKSITVQKELDLEFDLGNLLASDKNRVDEREFKTTNKEDFLRSLARDNTQLIINEIWKHPTERVEDVIVVKLPEPTTALPREKPPPKPKPPTKWEQFAKLKGIQKKKKTNLVWDEEHKEWRRRWGYKRAKDDTKEWVIEVPENADPNEDQFAKRNKAKTERVAKNEFNRLKNIARAQKLPTPGGGLVPTAQQSKAELSQALNVAKVSTASVGKFQERLPKEKAPKNTGKKRKFQPLIGDFSNERQNQLDILKVLDSKKPRIDMTRAVNKQMREEDRESASNARKGPGKKGRRGNMPGKGRGGFSGKGGSSGRGGFSGKGGSSGRGGFSGKGGSSGKGGFSGKGKGRGKGKPQNSRSKPGKR
ncbi:ribosome biogenesis regulatory protein homolog [Alosa alosa]|uniref:ribosome biogenesis regulatory protein homolog n=1 Tax=Alosa sapidissima TaxID=34773 RepID=UPI001C09CFA0|nr:ribosome biogenesis regulatory protein homolog [Alosa sapidissima]XP_048122357.1 ribosome biogenesis regulatory protein homolog [Alosa alosa]